jgi:hypothetical protein
VPELLATAPQSSRMQSSASRGDCCNVLTLDGGGTKGFQTLGVLKEIEALVGRRLGEHFQLIYGTSTGACTGAFLALGARVEDIAAFYREHIPTVLRERTPAGKSDALQEFCRTAFGKQDFDCSRGSGLLLGVSDFRIEPDPSPRARHAGIGRWKLLCEQSRGVCHRGCDHGPAPIAFQPPGTERRSGDLSGACLSRLEGSGSSLERHRRAAKIFWHQHGSHGAAATGLVSGCRCGQDQRSFWSSRRRSRLDRIGCAQIRSSFPMRPEVIRASRKGCASDIAVRRMFPEGCSALRNWQHNRPTGGGPFGKTTNIRRAVAFVSEYTSSNRRPNSSTAVEQELASGMGAQKRSPLCASSRQVA